MSEFGRRRVDGLPRDVWFVLEALEKFVELFFGDLEVGDLLEIS